MYCHILDSNTIINHKQKTLINHVKESLLNIELNKKIDRSIVLKVDAVFADQTQLQKMADNIS